MSIVTWIVRNWSKIKPVAIATWDLITLYESKTQANGEAIPGVEKEAKVVETLQTQFPWLASSIAKFAINMLLLFKRSKTKPALIEQQLKEAAKTEPEGTFEGEK